ncbi:hypothetical protein RINTHM_16120 [Richelia intracellularis HM01]|nr:hypothetical protein RINTHM_16120 [Richelia intracellularis HM01]
MPFLDENHWLAASTLFINIEFIIYLLLQTRVNNWKPYLHLSMGYS